LINRCRGTAVFAASWNGAFSAAGYTRAMSSVMSIAVSGMAAAERRLEVSARNVANVSTTGPLDAAPDDVRAAYAALRADQTQTAGGGTAVKVSRAAPATIAVSDPGSPFANADGLVAAPAVDLTNEAVQQLVARYSFAANAAVIRAEDKMTKSLLDLKL
jgi:flagellar basal-body rod protein FlgC